MQARNSSARLQAARGSLSQVDTMSTRKPGESVNPQRCTIAAVLGVLLCICFVVSNRGCTGHIAGPKGVREPVQTPEATSIFDYSTELVGLEEKPVLKEKTSKYDVLGVVCQSDMSTHPDNDLAIGYYYQIKSQYIDESLRKDGKLPAVFVLPLVGGGKKITKGFADYFAARGIPTMRMRRKRRAFDKVNYDVGYTNKVLIQSVIDARKLAHWLRNRPEIDPERIGCIGVSLGGMLACLFDAVEPEVNTSVLVLAGGDLADILSVGDEGHLNEVREGLMRKNNLSPEAVRPYIAGRTFSMWDYTSGIDPARVLMINANYDKVVPKPYAEELWRRLGEPEIRWLPLGHYSSVLALSNIKKWSLEFFRGKLAPGS